MALISVKDLTVAQPTKILFKDATFSIQKNDKVGIIGPNGCGKTTLLSQLSEATTDPRPEISTQKGLRITTLSQAVKINPDHTILDHLFQTSTPATKAMKHYQKALNEMEQTHNKKTEDAFAKAMADMDQANAWEYETKVSSILKELHIYDLNQLMTHISGGMQKKVALAQAFFEETDLMILDEPTNHLDIETIEWLETMLNKHPSALLMVTHDRYFLDKICSKIIEIDQQKVFSYNGNYQTYLEQKEQRYNALAQQEQRIQSILKGELAWLRQGPKARSTKQKARKDRIDTLINRQKHQETQSIELKVNEQRLGKKIVELKDVTKSYSNKRLLSQFSYTFKKGERIGILGPNGVGKTTLLNMIIGALKPDSGEIDIGINTKFGYFDQLSQDFDTDLTIFEHVSEIGSLVTTSEGKTISVSKFLEQFLFPSQMLKTPIGKLSGGERRRLYLVCLLLKNPNFLLFDEPTNDLDIQTLSILEDFLLNFSGCTVVISHDRYFMDRVVDQLLVFNKDGQITSFPGNYSEYAETKKASKQTKAPKPTQATQKKAHIATKKEKATLRKLEKEIESLEKEKKDLETQFTASEINAEDYEKLGKNLKTLSEKIDQRMKEWETLAEELI